VSEEVLVFPVHLNRGVAEASAKSGEIPALSRNGGSEQGNLIQTSPVA